MNFCSRCGEAVQLKIPAGDNRPRYICDSCGTIHYENPRIIAGCLPVYGTQVLLCRRAIEPRLGYWTLPAGFMENGESTEQAARRETQEEACAEVEIQSLYTLTSIVHVNQVQLIYLAELNAPEFGGVARGTPVRRGGDPLGAARLRDDPQRPAPLFRGSQTGTLPVAPRRDRQ